MEFVKGISLSNIWFELGERDIISLLHQLMELESKIMSITFPAGRSLYCTEDLEMVASLGTPLEDKRFFVRPDTRIALWYGRRSQLDIDRGPRRLLPFFFITSLKLTDTYRQKCQ